MDSLDVRFGQARAPERVDKWEDRPPVSRCRLNDQIAGAMQGLAACAASPLLTPSACTTNFLWVIAADGSLIVSVEEIALRPPDSQRSGYPRRRGFQHPSEERKLGHPTLVDGGLARIAGEVALDESETGLRWVINASSGRYCRRLPPTTRQIEAAAEEFRAMGVDVEIDYLI